MTAKFQRVGLAEAAPLFARDDVLVLDCRDPGSYAQGRIGEAEHLWGNALESLLFSTPKTTPVLIYCYHGNASQIHAQTFGDFGFREVYSLDGGYEGWRAAQAVQQLATPQQASSASAVPSPALQQWLTEQGFPADGINARTANDFTPLMRAAQFAAADILSELIELKADLEARNADGNTALWLACVSDDPKIVHLLAKAGINLDNQNDTGSSPLMYAASSGRAGIVAALIEAGANLFLENPDSFTALDMAATEECLALLRNAAKKAKASA